MSTTDPAAEATADLESLEAAGLAAFREAATADAVEDARIEFLGQKQGRVRAAQERLARLGQDAHAERGSDRIGTHQRLPDISGRQQHIHHAVERRPRRFRHGHNDHVHGVGITHDFHPNSGTNEPFLSETHLLDRVGEH